MYPVFIISSANIENESNEFLKYIFINENDEFQNIIVDKFVEFQKSVFSIQNIVSDRRDEIIFICVRYIESLNSNTAILKELFKSPRFIERVSKVFFIDIKEDAETPPLTNYYKENNQIITELKKQSKDKQFYNFLFYMQNSNGGIIENKIDLYFQIKSLIYLLHKETDLLSYIKTDKFYAFGSSIVALPYDKLLVAGKFYNNAFQLFNLLTGKKINYDIFNELEEVHSNTDQATRIFNKYANNVKAIDVIEEQNTLWAELELNEAEHFFSNPKYNSFSDFFKEKDIFSKISDLQEQSIYNSNKRNQVAILTNEFFNTTALAFAKYRNEDLLLLQKELNEKKRNLTQLSFVKIDNFISNIFKNNKYDRYTSIEAVSKILNILANGTNETPSEYNIPFLIAQQPKTPFERFNDRKFLISELEKKSTSLKSELLNQDKEINQRIDEYEVLQQQMKFKVFDNIKSWFDFKKYSLLLKTSVFSSIGAFLTFFILYKLELDLEYLISLPLIPLIIGIVILFLYNNKLKKHIENINNLIAEKRIMLIRFHKLHDEFIKNYLIQIKYEFIYNLFLDLKKYVENKHYQLEEFRKYIFEHLIFSIKNYNAVKLTFSIFELSIINKDTLFDLLNKLTFFYFTDKPIEVTNLFNLYTKTALTEFVFKPFSLSINFFIENENDIPPKKEDVHRVVYEKINKKINSIFGDKTEIIDIKQGEVGDCYLMAALGAIANSKPDFIANMFLSQDIENEIIIRLFDKNKSERFVSVDNHFWLKKDDKEPIYAKYSDIDENSIKIWTMLLEKAWAKLNGGFDNIVGSLNSKMKFDYGLTISGYPFSYQKIEIDAVQDELYKLIADKFSDKFPITLGSRTGKLTSGRHAFILKNIDFENKLFDIYNPWGHTHCENVDIKFIIENFDEIEFYNLNETSESIEIPDYEKLKVISRIEKIENDFDLFYGKSISTVINNDIEALNINYDEISENIYKLSQPLFVKPENCKTYPIIFGSHIDKANFKTYKDKPTQSTVSLSKDYILYLTNIFFWDNK